MKLHLGCGKRNFGKSWVHIDIDDLPHVTHHDVTDLPYGDATVDLIYASHLLEYFDRQEVVSILYEWRRVLKPSGVLRLAVPDFEQMARLYIAKGEPLGSFIGPLYGRIDTDAGVIYHKTVYDFASLQTLLLSIGFRGIRRYHWRLTDHAKYDDCSQAYIPPMAKDSGILISLNVEATK